MKKLFTLLTFILLTTSNVIAQYQFDWMQEAGDYNKTAVMMATDNSNNIVVTGYLTSNSIFTRKYSSTGNLQWEVSNSSGIQSNYQKPIWTNFDSSGNIFVVGKRYSGVSTETPDAIVALKYNASGALLWKKNIPVSASTVSSSQGFSLRSEVDIDGNLYIGTSQLIPYGLTLIKLSPTGTTLFQTSNDTNSGYGFGSMRLKNNKIYMTGAGDTAHGTPLVVWDTAGNLIFSAGFIHVNNINPQFNSGFGEDLEVDDNGNTYILGKTNHTSVVQTNNIDILVQKVSPTGTLLWQHNYDFGNNDYPSKFALGGNRISIISTSYANDPNWNTQQIDTEGNLLWNTIYNALSGTDEVPYYVTTTPIGEPIVIGKGGPTASPLGTYSQMVVLKYSNTGVQQWINTPNIYGGSGLYCKIANDNSLFAISEHNMSVYHYNSGQLATNQFSSSKISVGPNPFSDKITIKLNENETNVIASIYHVTGKLLFNINLNTSTNEVDLSTLTKGIYFCQLKSDKIQQTIKLVKE